MGLLDKVKEQAAVAGAAAKDAAHKGQAKLDEIQAKRAADDMLHDLGALYYASTKDGLSADRTAEMDRLVQSLRDHEAAHGPLSA